jgi:hypothetical protein
MAPHRIGDTAIAEAAPWIERLARVGFAAKGVLYLTIGVLSARAAMGAGGRTVTDTHGALDTLNGTFGRPLLVIIALGLAGYGVWRLIDAIVDAEDHGRDAKGIAKRIGAAIRGLVHLALAGTAISLALWQGGSGGHDAKAKHWTARLLDAPGGELLVWGVAAAFAGYGLYQLYCAWTTKLDKRLELGRLGSGARRLVIAISRFGIAARGIVFVTVAVLFGRAAMNRDASEAGGTGASMRELFAFGKWPFIAIAAGVAAYGIYELIEARYRRIRVR